MALCRVRLGPGWSPVRPCPPHRVSEDDVVVSTEEQIGRACGHVVKIYDDDHDLVRGVSGFLAEGIVAGDAVIVVATPAASRRPSARTGGIGS